MLTGPPATSPGDVVHRLLAVQAQDPRGFRLSVRARSSGFTARGVDDALNDRRLVVTWLNRGTLHLVRADDYWWLHSLTTPALRSGNRRRLADEGVSERETERAVQVVTAEVGEHGPRSRRELRVALDAAGIPTRGQALIHLLAAASLAGRVVRGPMRGPEHCYVSVREWLGSPAPTIDRAAALTRLARRYLAGHGPATATDLARWAGLGMRDARAALDGIRGELVEAPDVVTGGGEPLVDLAHREDGDEESSGDLLPPPRLLGPYDPLLHGWASRAFVTGEHAAIVTTNGLFRPFALVGGRAVATWRLNSGTIVVRPLEPITVATERALDAEAGRVLRFLELPPADAVFEGS